jgi:hypothetical protein
LMLGVGLLELGVASVCLFARATKIALTLVAWLATIFVLYRVGLFLVGYHKPCSCLGNLTDALHISPEMADAAMKVVLGYLLIGGYGSIFWLWLQELKNSSLSSPKSFDSKGQTALQ